MKILFKDKRKPLLNVTFLNNTNQIKLNWTYGLNTPNLRYLISYALNNSKSNDYLIESNRIKIILTEKEF